MSDTLPEDPRVQPNGKGTARPFRVLWLLVLPLLVIGIASCGGPAARAAYEGIPEGKPPGLGSSVPDPKEVVETKPKGTLPDFLAAVTGPAKDRLTVQYQGAVDHYDSYKYIPCYCGCAIYATAHKNLAECFVKEMAANGDVTFTDHSTMCDQCQTAAQMTLDGIAAGTPLKDVRTAVFEKLNYTQIWTDTDPVP
ncbi:MAG TPA: PCYCGC motif-containing (lipo)protein [Chloroflexia bacterium]|nr:PCYCGC motif-containing (lipo)protein [Chloroflexia bacterium]